MVRYDFGFSKPLLTKEQFLKPIRTQNLEKVRIIVGKEEEVVEQYADRMNVIPWFYNAIDEDVSSFHLFIYWMQRGFVDEAEIFDEHKSDIDNIRIVTNLYIMADKMLITDLAKGVWKVLARALSAYARDEHDEGAKLEDLVPLILSVREHPIRFLFIYKCLIWGVLAPNFTPDPLQTTFMQAVESSGEAGSKLAFDFWRFHNVLRVVEIGNLSTETQNRIGLGGSSGVWENWDPPIKFTMEDIGKWDIISLYFQDEMVGGLTDPAEVEARREATIAFRKFVRDYLKMP